MTVTGAAGPIKIRMGSRTIETSGDSIAMDTVAVNRSGRIYVPLRFIEIC